MKYLTRAECGLRPPKYRSHMSGYYNGVFTHHGASPNYPSDPVATWRGYQNFHMDGQGWSDIAYSWGVTHDGRILEGRGWGVAGGHTAGYNSTSHAVCYIGDSSAGEVPAVALSAIREVHDEHDRRYGQGPHRGHGEVNQTGCPGTRLQAWMDAGMPVESAPPTIPPTDPEDDEMVYIIFNTAKGTPNYLYLAGTAKKELATEPQLEALFGPDWVRHPRRIEVDGDWLVGLRQVGSDNIWE